MKFVCEAEQQKIIRLQHDETSTPKHLSKQFMKADLTAQKERYKSKVMNGCYEKKIINDTEIDKHLSNSWKKDKFVSSQLKNYHSPIQEQELPTKYLKNKRARDSGKTLDCNSKCRLCTTNVEDINHMIAGCSHMSAKYYLPLRHNEVAKTVFSSHLKKFYPSKEIKFSSEPEYIYEKMVVPWTLCQNV